MSAMRIGVLLCLLLMACGLRHVDVVMDPTSTPGTFSATGIGTLTSPMPEYPEMARAAGIEGSCRVSVRFSADWTAESIQVAIPAGNGALDKSSCSTAMRVTFEPAPFSRLRLPVHADIDYRFTRQASMFPDSADEFVTKIESVRVWTQ
jgi:TonB family protein